MKPRILFIEPQQDIDEIGKKIEESNAEEIVLMIPQKAILFESSISLKILQERAEKMKKTIFLITKDSQGKQFAKNIGMHCVESMDLLQKRKKTLPPQKKKKKEVPSPVLPEKKQHVAFQQKKQEILEILSRPKKGVLFLLVGISFFLLLLVSFLALPGSTIFISPQKKVVETTINVTLSTGNLENATDSWRQHILPAVEVESIFEKTIPFETITRRFTGKNAEGSIVVFNDLSEELTLRPTTQFQTASGIIFRSKEWIKVPAGGKASVEVIADEQDIFGEFVGARANLEQENKLSLPRLTSEMQKSVWAEIHEPIGGGVSGSIPEVTEQDLEIAKSQINDLILREARRDSEGFLRRKNALENRDLLLVPGEEFLDAEVLEIEVPEDLVGKNREQFSIRSRMRVRMMAFSQKEMLSLLRAALIKAVDPGMELIDLDTESIFPELVDMAEDKSWIKITVSARGTEAFVIEAKTVEGVRFVNRIKDATAGKSVGDAQKILQNFQEIARVKISLWPPLVGNIPRLHENISVQLMEEE